MGVELSGTSRSFSFSSTGESSEEMRGWKTLSNKFDKFETTANTKFIIIISMPKNNHTHGLVQDCGNLVANTLELPQSWAKPSIYHQYFDGLVQERRNSIAYARDLCLSCINPSIYYPIKQCYFVCTEKNIKVHSHWICHDTVPGWWYSKMPLKKINCAVLTAVGFGEQCLPDRQSKLDVAVKHSTWFERTAPTKCQVLPLAVRFPILCHAENATLCQTMCSVNVALQK